MRPCLLRPIHGHDAQAFVRSIDRATKRYAPLSQAACNLGDNHHHDTSLSALVVGVAQLSRMRTGNFPVTGAAPPQPSGRAILERTMPLIWRIRIPVKGPEHIARSGDHLQVARIPIVALYERDSIDLAQ